VAFKPGQSGNPSGRPKLDPELKALRELTGEHFKEIANLVILGQKDEIAAIVADPGAPLLKRWLAKMAEQGFNRNNQAALEFFLNRLIGKVPDKAEHSGPDGKPLRLEDLIVGGLAGGPKGKAE